jgi:uncharacterized RDD family membrane protein YckC
MKNELLDDLSKLEENEEDLIRPKSVGAILRSVAFFFDVMALIVISVIVGTFISIFTLIVPEYILSFVYRISFVGMLILYYPLLESSRLQASIGKFVFSIKVVDEKKERLTFGRALGRFLGSLMACILVLGILMIPFTDKRGMNDIVSNTYVVKNKEA